MKLEKIIKKVFVIALIPILIFTSLSIKGTDSNKKIVFASSDMIWCAPATVKIRKDHLYTLGERGEAKLNILMCKNETEGGQIILSPTKNIDSYEIILSDLSDGKGNVIPKENIEAFNQHYMRTYTQSNKYHEPGWYPDALIPFNNAKAKGDTKVVAGDNQGIYVRIETTEDTVAGDYSGNFILNIDGVDYAIPLNVHVYDFVAPEGEWPKSLSTIWLNYLTQGEYDSSIDMWESYTEFFLDYGLSCLDIPIEGSNVEGYLERLEKYYDRISAYDIPYLSSYHWEPKANTWRYGPDYDEFEIFIKKAIKYSVENQKDFLSKAYIYNFYIDEYGATGAYGEERIITATYFAARCYEVYERAIKYFDTHYGAQYIDSVVGLRESIKNIGVISVEGSYIDGIWQQYNVLCPSIGSFTRSLNADGENWVEDVIADEANKAREVWWYHSIGADYPKYPGYQIDDPVVDERIQHWMQYKYNIAGHLYWANNLYTSNIEYGLSPGDEWTEANRCTGGKWNGDGYLVYPGYNYGIYGPIGTIRLENIRDGMEEYKWLNLLEQEYQTLSNYYGEQTNIDALMKTIYDSLFTVTAPKYDVNNYAYQRNTLANSILAAQGEEKLAFLSHEEDNDNYYVSVVIDSSYTINSNDIVSTQLTSNNKGRIYNFKISKDAPGNIYLSFTYENSSRSGRYEKYLGVGSTEVVSFADVAHAENVFISEKSGSSIVGLGEIGGRTGLNMNLTTYSGLQGLTKYAYFEFKAEYLLSIMNSPTSIYIDIYNNGEYDLNLVVYATSAKVDNIVANATLSAKKWTRVEISQLLSMSSSKTLRFALPNYVTAFDYTTEIEIPISMHDIYISRLAYSKV